jgi:isoleucyl-tRNA synthetase
LGLKQNDMPESVHLCDLPKANTKLIDKRLEESMTQVREIVAKALAKRADLGIRVRQPLSLLKIPTIKPQLPSELKDLIKQEVNVKNVVFDDKIKQGMELDATITPELKEEWQVREIIRHIQDLRKKAGLTPKDKIAIYYSGDNSLAQILEKNKNDILEQTRADKIESSSFDKASFDKDKSIKIDEAEFWLAIKKIKL